MTEEAVRKLKEHTRSVTGVCLAPAGAPMIEIHKDFVRLPNEVVTASAFDIDDKPDPAGVVLVCRVVKALPLW